MKRFITLKRIDINQANKEIGPIAINADQIESIEPLTNINGGYSHITLASGKSMQIKESLTAIIELSAT